jgi:hypothetical protein
MHKEHPNWSYSRVSKALELDCPHRSASVLRKIKQGWIPSQDPEWVEWKNKQ